MYEGSPNSIEKSGENKTVSEECASLQQKRLLRNNQYKLNATNSVEKNLPERNEMH